MNLRQAAHDQARQNEAARAEARRQELLERQRLEEKRRLDIAKSMLTQLRDMNPIFSSYSTEDVKVDNIYYFIQLYDEWNKPMGRIYSQPNQWGHGRSLAYYKLRMGNGGTQFKDWAMLADLITRAYPPRPE